MIVCLIVPTSCGSRGTAPQIGTITGAEFASVIRKAGVELEKGTTVLGGTGPELIGNPYVREAFLGISEASSSSVPR